MKMGMYICVVKVRLVASVPDSCGQSDIAVSILDVNTIDVKVFGTLRGCIEERVQYRRWNTEL